MKEAKGTVDPTWQDFEVKVKEILEGNDFNTSFRVVFRDGEGKAEIDVVAERYETVLCVDAKRYNRNWHRRSALKREAEKHRKRCLRFSRLLGRRAIPVIVSLIDDELYLHEGCIIVPFKALNDFLLNLHYYLVEFGYSEI
jgi:Holliday junction resolvase-like predicted endonuclease